jgi:hypothetical protein
VELRRSVRGQSWTEKTLKNGRILVGFQRLRKPQDAKGTCFPRNSPSAILEWGSGGRRFESSRPDFMRREALRRARRRSFSFQGEDEAVQRAVPTSPTVTSGECSRVRLRRVATRGGGLRKRLGSVVAAPDATLVAPSCPSVSMVCSDGPNRLPLAFAAIRTARPALPNRLPEATTDSGCNPQCLRSVGQSPRAGWLSEVSTCRRQVGG